MEKPNLNNMWETFIRFSWEDIIKERHINIIRKQVHPLISGLKDEEIIDWYHFLIHDRNSGVPTSENDDNPYFHIRFSLKKNVNPEDILPSYCVLTRKIERERVEAISGLDKSLFKNEDIEEAWRIIGEQSEWLFNMLDIFKENINIPLKYV